MPYAGGSPYGDIFRIPTTTIDNIANRLYAEGRQRDAQKQQDLKTLDDDFGKNIAGIKSADVNDVTAAYNDFKQASIALQKKGNKATPQDQMEVMLKRANAYEAIGKSKEDKERIKQYGLTIKSDNKGRYKTDAAQKLTQWLNTPTSKRDVDADQSEIKFAYSYPNLAKLTTDALGKKTEYKMPTGKPSAKGDLYDDEEVYNKFNSANQIFDHIFNTVATDPNNNAFTLTVMDNMTDVEKDALKTKYFAKINDPAFKKLYGDTLPFPESASKTDLGEAAALATMGIVANLSIDKLRTDSKVNANRNMDAKFAQQEKMATTNDFYIRRRNEQRAALGLIANNETQYNTMDLTGDGQDIEIPATGGVWSNLTSGKKPGKISGGVVYNSDGTPMESGEVEIKGNKLPALVVAVLRHAKVFDSRMPQAPNVKAVIKNGEIKMFKTPGGDVSREQMLEFQTNYSKERKGESLFKSKTPAKKQEGIKKAILD